ncbi:MAG TPA: hypothetical protein VHG53_01230 [Candidatus Limnocylindria bacterium]|nr:hypothetical protein [Candidatus Limnocylindria bacterium]
MTRPLVLMLAAIAIVIGVAHTSGPGYEGRRPARTPGAVRVEAGPYNAAVGIQQTEDGQRAVIFLTDVSGQPVGGKPLTGLIAYEGTGTGHEHHDILISREDQPGRYVLDLRAVGPGPWLLTIAVGDEGRGLYAFTVR